eukprot:5655251-Pleurochrysis_carterae.AAC.1
MRRRNLACARYTPHDGVASVHAGVIQEAASRRRLQALEVTAEAAPWLYFTRGIPEAQIHITVHRACGLQATRPDR